MKADEGIRGVVERYVRGIIDRLENIGILGDIKNKEAEVRELSYSIRESLPLSSRPMFGVIHQLLDHKTTHYFNEQHGVRLNQRSLDMQADIAGVQKACVMDIQHYYKPENKPLHVEYGELAAAFIKENLASENISHDCSRRDFIQLADQITSMVAESANDTSLQGEVSLQCVIEDKTKEILSIFLVNCGAEPDCNAAHYRLRDWKFLDHLVDHTIMDTHQKDLDAHRADIHDVLMELVSKERPSDQLYFTSESEGSKQESYDNPYAVLLATNLRSFTTQALNASTVDEKSWEYAAMIAAALQAIDSEEEFDMKRPSAERKGPGRVLSALQKLENDEDTPQDLKHLLRTITDFSQKGARLQEIIRTVKSTAQQWNSQGDLGYG